MGRSRSRNKDRNRYRNMDDGKDIEMGVEVEGAKGNDNRFGLYGLRAGVSWMSIFVLPLDLRALALARMSFGLLTLIWLAEEHAKRETFLFDDGICPRIKAITHPYTSSFSVYFGAGDELPLSILMLFHALVSLCFMVGHHTHLSSFGLFIMNTSLAVRNHCTYTEGYALQSAMLLWFCFLPSGKAWSVDNLSGVPEPKIANVPHHLPRGLPSSREKGICGGYVLHNLDFTRHALSWRGYVLIVQLAAVYYLSGIRKSGMAWREFHTAMELLLSSSIAKGPMAPILLSFSGLCKALTWLSIRIEVYGWWSLLIPLERVRLLAVLLLMGFHVLMHLTLDIHLFHMVMLCGLSALLPSIALDPVSQHLNRLFPVIKARIGAVTHAFPWISTFMHTSWSPPEQRRQSFLTGLPLRMSFRKCYLTARNVIYLITTGLLWVVFYNTIGVCQDLGNKADIHAKWCMVPDPIPHRLGRMINAVTLKQSFQMFAPEPGGTIHQWITIPGITVDHQTRDIIQNGELSFDLAHGVPYNPKSVTNPNRWSKWPHLDHRLFKFFANPTHTKFLPSFKTHICTQWNARYSDGRTLMGFAVIGVWHSFDRIHFAHNSVKPFLMARHWCKEDYKEEIMKINFVNMVRDGEKNKS